MRSRRWNRAQLAGRLLTLLLLSLASAAAVSAQTASPPPAPAPSLAPTPDAAAILTQANAAATRADDVARLADRTLSFIQWFIPIGGTLLGVILVGIGFDVRRGTKAIQQEYKDQLKLIRDDYQLAQRDYQTQLDQVRKDYQAAQERAEAAQARITEHAAAIEKTRREFTAAGQSLVLLGLGNRLFLDGKHQQAIETYLEARRLQPDDAEINYRLGRVYSNVGRYEAAIEAFLRSLNVRPMMPEANMELGLVYRRQADMPRRDPAVRAAEYRLAERYLQRAIELRPSYEDALGALGGLYRREGRYPEALAQYQHAVNVDPNSSYALGNVASLLWYTGDTTSARYYFERVERVATDRIQSGREFGYWDLYDRALARQVLKREGALEDHQRAIGLTPSAENLRSVLDNLALLQRAPTTIDGLDEFIALINAKIATLVGSATDTSTASADGRASDSAAPG